jgi:hypothetical protein
MTGLFLQMWATVFCRQEILLAVTGLAPSKVVGPATTIRDYNVLGLRILPPGIGAHFSATVHAIQFVT